MQPPFNLSTRDLKKMIRTKTDTTHGYDSYVAELRHRRESRHTRLMLIVVCGNALLVGVDILVRLIQA